MSQYIGSQTVKALANFPFSGPRVHLELIYAIVEIKKAAAGANHAIGDLPQDICDGILIACDDILSGKLDDQFSTPALQGGAGTSINMNVNEVIAGRATELLKSQGKKTAVHPNDHVNMAQSTNDVNPSALKIVCLRLGDKLIEDLSDVVRILETKAKEFTDVHKLGRTHLQDAVPVTLGEELASYAYSIDRGTVRVKQALAFFSELSLGGTAIGTCVNASPAYIDAVYKELEGITGLPLRPARNFMSQTSSQTDFCALSHALVALTIDASKIAVDLRLMASGPKGGLGEIILEELQAGSSIMPGKVNPILPETVNQLYFLVSGNNVTIEQAAHASFLELANMFPILADRLISSLKLTDEVLVQFANKCVKTIRVNRAHCRYILEHSTAYATLLTPKLGYDAVAAMVKESMMSGKTIRELVLRKKLLREEEFNDIVHVER